MDLFDGNPVIATVVDELRARGAINTRTAEALLPELELEWGALTDRERAAVLAHFAS